MISRHLILPKNVHKIFVTCPKLLDILACLKHTWAYLLHVKWFWTGPISRTFCHGLDVFMDILDRTKCSVRFQSLLFAYKIETNSNLKLLTVNNSKNLCAKSKKSKHFFSCKQPWSYAPAIRLNTLGINKSDIGEQCFKKLLKWEHDRLLKWEGIF